MSTIQSSSDHVIINADGSSKDIKFQANGVEVGSLSSSGVMTATSFAGSGANLTGISSVGGATGVDFNDNVKARFGTGNDLEIYHDGTSSIIKETNASGDFHIQGKEIVMKMSNGENSAIFREDGGVELMHNAVQKFETTATGINLLPDTHRKFASRIYNSGTDDANVWTSYHGSNGNIREVGLEGSIVRFYTGADSGTSTTKRLEITADGRGLSQFTAKVWCQMDMSNMSINDSHNCASITDISTGQGRVNFTVALANSSYAAVTSGPAGYISATSNLGVGNVNLRSSDTNGTAADTDKNMLVVFGD